MQVDLQIDELLLPPAPPRRLRQRLLLVLWPAFLMAALLEALVFVVIEPAALHALGVSDIAVYSVAFLVFWLLMAASGAITLMLDTPGPWQNS
jgi:hypothetical protein